MATGHLESSWAKPHSRTATVPRRWHTKFLQQSRWFLGGGVILAAIELNGHYPWYQSGLFGFVAVFLSGGISGLIIKGMLRK